MTNTKQGANKERWQRVVKDRALAPLFPRVIIETQGEFLLRVLQGGTVSTNVYLRRLHNFCLDMNWLPWPLMGAGVFQESPGDVAATGRIRKETGRQ